MCCKGLVVRLIVVAMPRICRVTILFEEVKWTRHNYVAFSLDLNTRALSSANKKEENGGKYQRIPKAKGTYIKSHFPRRFGCTNPTLQLATFCPPPTRQTPAHAHHHAPVLAAAVERTFTAGDSFVHFAQLVLYFFRFVVNARRNGAA